MFDPVNESKLLALFQKQLPFSPLQPELAQRLQQQVVVTAVALLQPKPYRDWREEQRCLARQLKQQGWKQRRIAEILQVSPSAVSYWLKRQAHQNLLHPRKRSDMKPRLSEEKVKQLARLLVKFADESAAAAGAYPPTMSTAVRMN